MQKSSIYHLCVQRASPMWGNADIEIQWPPMIALTHYNTTPSGIDGRGFVDNSCGYGTNVPASRTWVRSSFGTLGPALRSVPESRSHPRRYIRVFFIWGSCPEYKPLCCHEGSEPSNWLLKQPERPSSLLANTCPWQSGLPESSGGANRASGRTK